MLRYGHVLVGHVDSEGLLIRTLFHVWDHRGHDRIVHLFTVTYAINA
jgi:hypothetical protein